MIKRILNYFRREDEIRALKREIGRLTIQLNRLDELVRFENLQLKDKILVIAHREQILESVVLELKEGRSFYAN